MRRNGSYEKGKKIGDEKEERKEKKLEGKEEERKEERV